MQEKKGTVPWSTVFALIIGALSLATILYFISTSVGSPQFTLNAKEQVCRQSTRLAQSPLGNLGFKPLCSTGVVPFSEKSILKHAKKGEDVKDVAARDILEYMQRCKDMVGWSDSGFLSAKNCYICYSLRTDATTPYLSKEDVTSYAFLYREPNGQRYFYELQKDDRAVIVNLPDGLGQKSKATASQQPKGVSRTKDYAIAYATFKKGSIAKILTGSAAVCGIAAVSWIIPLVGQFTGALTLPFCVVSLGGGSFFSLFEILQTKGEGDGAILLMDYKSLEDYGCDSIAS